MQLYFEAKGDYPESSLDSLVDTGFISIPTVLKSQSDAALLGFYSEFLECVTAGRVRTKYSQSYEYHYRGQPGSARDLRIELLELDPDSSLFAIRSHGENLQGRANLGCDGYLLRKVGKIVRFRSDGSAHVGQFTLDEDANSKGACVHKLYSEKPDICDLALSGK